MYLFGFLSGVSLAKEYVFLLSPSACLASKRMVFSHCLFGANKNPREAPSASQVQVTCAPGYSGSFEKQQTGGVGWSWKSEVSGGFFYWIISCVDLLVFNCCVMLDALDVFFSVVLFEVAFLKDRSA